MRPIYFWGCVLGGGEYGYHNICYGMNVCVCVKRNMSRWVLTNNLTKTVIEGEENSRVCLGVSLWIWNIHISKHEYLRVLS